jgi:hypothetical protein
MDPVPKNFTLRPGTTFGPHVFTALDGASNPVDVAGWSVWAEVKDKPNGTIELDLTPEIVTAGTVGNFTANATTDLLTLTAHGLVLGHTVRFSTTDTLPDGLLADTNYYVIAEGLTANDFKVSLIPNGTAVDILDTGTGTHTVSLGLGQILIPEITDEESHDWENFKGQWDLIMENPAGQRLGAFIAGKFNITNGITNPPE